MNARRVTMLFAAGLTAATQAGCSILYEAASEDATLSRPVDAATVEAAVRRAPGVNVARVVPAVPYRVFFVIPATQPERILFTDSAAPRMIGWVEHQPESERVYVEGRYGNQRPTDRDKATARESVRRIVDELRRAADAP